MVSRKTNGPAFLRFVEPIIETLKEFGNSGTASEVSERAIERLNINETEQNQTTSSGQPRVRNQIAWARYDMVKTNLLEASQRGVRSLTEDGRNAKLDHDAIYSLFKDIHVKFSKNCIGVDFAGRVFVM